MEKNDMDISTYDGFAEAEPLVLFAIKPNPVEFVFYSCAEEVGKFSYDEDKHEWNFIGDVDASAKKFVEAISRYLPIDNPPKPG
ncbi:MAG: hypothetical protein O7D95_02255 [Betaproteobacteria bacterium]|nr:hypothetical protein [Betaproteobacteria bacterium]